MLTYQYIIITIKNMNNFFKINSVWIVWASSEEWKIGNSLLKNLSYFKWKKYWINPKGWEYNWIKFIKSISELPIILDVLVFAIPAKFVLASLIESWKKWIKRVIIISAWFKEIWNTELENELIKVANKYNIDLLWPNCLWYVDTSINLNLSFWTKTLESCSWKNCNNIAMISQSWAMAVALTDWAFSRKMWFSKMISMWNKAWLDENSLLLELEKDSNTKVIALYLESIEKWADFFKITKRMSKKYPIIIIKSGISEKWELAASSHTWALMSSKEILLTSFENSWIHYTQSLEDFFLWSQIFSKTSIQDIPEELVIITNAWWPWVIATDHAEFYDVELSSFNKEEKEILKEWLSTSASVSNPIDIIWDATSITYKQILNNLSKLTKKRAILILLTAQSVTDVENIANVILDFNIKNPSEFIMVSFMGGELIEKWRQILNNAGILEYDYPKKAILSYSTLIKQKKWQNTNIIEDYSFKKPNNIEYLKWKLKLENKFCSSYLTWEILESFNINYCKEILINSKSDLEWVYKKMWNKYIVARINSADIPHKTDIWGVILNIWTKEETIKAYNEILENVAKKAPNAKINWVTFSKMINKTTSTRDIFIWFKRDKSFWNIIIVGMWWIYVNVFEDVSRRIGLVSKIEIKEMISELKIFPILKWVRGELWIDFDKLISIIYKLQFIFNELTEISEIDINPIFANENESIIIDAKFYL